MMWEGLSPPYRTIVADPPWAQPFGYPSQSRSAGKWAGPVQREKPLPYSVMELAEIKALTVGELAAQDARLFLWTTSHYLPDAFSVAEGWGFRYKQALVWHKRDGNMGGSVAPCSAEFLLVCVKGTPRVLAKASSSVVLASQSKQHSRKPDEFMDIVERVSPGPYVELFSRSPRMGWDAWGFGYEGVPRVASHRG